MLGAMNSPPPPTDTARLFIGLWPDDEVRRALQAHADAWTWPHAARRVAEERLHMTLHFLGAVPRHRIDALVQALDVPATPFELELAETALWPRGIAVLGPTQVPEALAGLHGRLLAALERFGCPTEGLAWKPHVTLARDAQGARPPAAVEAIRWRVHGHALVESTARPALRYRVLQRWS
jgi:2'-5' RNA ligase